MHAARAVFKIVGSLAIVVGAVRVADNGSLEIRDQIENLGLIILGAALLFIGLILRGGEGS